MTAMSIYSVKEIYYTLQGEGAQSGRAAVFCRFAGCNLWSGREQDRGRAECQFCDTDFVGVDGPGGSKFASAEELASLCRDVWQGNPESPFVVLTGGEPMLQVDAALVDMLHAHGFEIAIETNGTLETTPGIDWICVSPKAGTTLAQTQGNELKLVYPQAGQSPEDFEQLKFRHFFLQPMDGPLLEKNTRQAIAYCLRHPKWRLSLQSHKLLNIP